MIIGRFPLLILTIALIFTGCRRKTQPTAASVAPPAMQGRIYILDLKGTHTDCAPTVQEMLKWGGRSSRIIKAREITSTVKCGVDTIVIPGGYDYDLAMEDLKKHDATHFIRRHVVSGGTYIGHCLGADMAPLLGIFAGTVEDPAPNKGPLCVRTLWFNGTTSRFMFFRDGPRFRPTKPVTVLATFADDAPETGMKAGEAAAITYAFGKGKVGLISPHPEADEEWMSQIDDPDGMDYDLGLYVYDQVLGALPSQAPATGK